MKTNHTKDEKPECCLKCADVKSSQGRYYAKCQNESCECHTKDNCDCYKYPETQEVGGHSRYCENTHTKDEHSGVEESEFNELETAIINIVYAHATNHSRFEEQVRSNLTSLQENHEREKREMVEDVLKMIDYESGFDRRAYTARKNQFDKGCIACADNITRRIKDIAKKHNITL